jgi:carboxypeptidase Q
MREVKPVDKPLLDALDDKELKELTEWPVKPRNRGDFMQQFMKRLALREAVGKFLADEHALAVITPSRDGRTAGAPAAPSSTTAVPALAGRPTSARHANPLPVVVMAIENYGRVYRLLKANVPVSMEMNVDTKFTGDHEHGFDTIAEIPGTDPKLKDEVVMVGGHLDSWASGTGATDNGAGTVVAMEVMRILNTLQVKPRRTIRVALVDGRRSKANSARTVTCKQHFGQVPLSTAPDQLKLPEWVRKPGGPVQLET